MNVRENLELEDLIEATIQAIWREREEERLRIKYRALYQAERLRATTHPFDLKLDL